MNESKTDLAPRKRELRRLMKEKLASMSEASREVRSLRLCEHIYTDPLWASAEVVLAFSSMPGEPNLRPLLDAALEEGRIVGLPRMEKTDLVFHRMGKEGDAYRLHPFGVSEPDPGLPVLEIADMRNRVTLVLCPGLAFDPQGGRLGRGKGYYDRFLRSLGPAAGDGGGEARQVHIAGVCFALQIVESVPRGDDDVPVGSVFSEDGPIFV